MLLSSPPRLPPLPPPFGEARLECLKVGTPLDGGGSSSTSTSSPFPATAFFLPPSLLLCARVCTILRFAHPLPSPILLGGGEKRRRKKPYVGGSQEVGGEEEPPTDRPTDRPNHSLFASSRAFPLLPSPPFVP